MIDSKLKWQDLPVHEKWNTADIEIQQGGDPLKEKIIQVNATDVYIIGGNKIDNKSSLLKQPYNVSKSCLRINIYTGVVTKRKLMKIGR